jgi:hypothetical protein
MSKKSVAFLTLDWAKGTNPIEPNGCAWYRCKLPSEQLVKHDWTVGFAIPEYSKDLEFGAYVSKDTVYYGWDIVVFKLIMLKSVAEILEKKKPNQKIVVDIDDFYEGLHETNLAYSATDPEKNSETNREHYWSIIDHADAIITSTQFLYDFYTKEKKRKNVFLVRNAIDIDRWHKKNDYARGLPRVGWVGAIPWRSNDLETLNPALGEFLKKNRLEFHHSGHIDNLNVDARDLFGISDDTKFTHEPRKPVTRYPEMFRKIDIGLVPLNDIPFNHAKSTIKGLEYVASGIPFVSSYSPEYELLSKDGVGRVAYNQEDWSRHLEELLNPSVRKSEATENYRIVKEKHSMDARAKEWDEVMNNILDI